MDSTCDLSYEFFDRAPCGMHSIDADGPFLRITDAELALLGYAREELVGKMRIRDLVAPESLAVFDDQFPRFKTTGTMKDLRLELVHRDGSPIPVIVNAAAIYDARGRYIASRSVITDIRALVAEQKRSEQSLRENEERYRAVVEDQTETISRFLPDSTMIFANETYCRIFDKKAEQIVGHKWHPDAVTDDIPMIEARLRTLNADNPVVTIENRVYDGERRIRWMQFVNRGLFSADGRLLEIQSVGRDITERKRIEAALSDARNMLEDRVDERTRQLRQLTSELASNEEHERRAIARDLHDDLGQLLHVMRIKLDAVAGAPAVTADREIRDTVDALRSLTADASARIRSLTAQLSPPVLDTLGLIAALRWLGEEMERTYGMTVEVDDDETPLPLTPVQSATLYRAVRELLINISKHARTLYAQIEVRTDGRRLTLKVIDEGVGIANLDAALSGGAGFGLASIGERLRHLGGGMSADSRPDAGTTITLALPLATATNNEE